jgi:hypothetical protein
MDLSGEVGTAKNERPLARLNVRQPNPVNPRLADGVCVVVGQSVESSHAVAEKSAAAPPTDVGLLSVHNSRPLVPLSPAKNSVLLKL